MLLMFVLVNPDESPSIVRHNATSVSIVYEPSIDQQKKKSQYGIQGQFVVQYDVNRTSTEDRGGEIHVSLTLFSIKCTLTSCSLFYKGRRWIFRAFLCAVLTEGAPKARSLRVGY